MSHECCDCDCNRLLTVMCDITFFFFIKFKIRKKKSSTVKKVKVEIGETLIGEK